MSQAKVEIEEKDKKKSHSFDFSYWPILVDYALRWLLFETWRYGLIAEWLFWLSQLILIPLIIGGFWATQREQGIKKKYEISGTVNIEIAAWQGFVCFLLVLSGTYITYETHREWPLWLRSACAISVFVLYGMYVGGLAITAVRTTSREDRLKEKEALEAALIDDERDVIDANDIRIVRMETEISSVSQRVDSYTLESALFGALAFSGFLTLVASDKPILTDIQILTSLLSNTLARFAQTGVAGTFETIGSSISQSNLMAIVTVETLICSMLFLSVIVSRLRFYGILRKVDYAVRVARTYNNKEEEVFVLTLQMSDTVTLNNRLERLTRKVGDAIDHAEPLFRDLRFVANYMWGFRNLGIGSFILILVTSAFLVSKGLGVAFISLSVLAYVYATFDEWWRARRIKQIPFFLALERRIFRISRRSK